MRVLYFHQHFSTPQGSTGHRSYEMARGLISRGHQVTMVCGSYKGAVTGLSMPFSDKGIRRGEVDGIDVIEFDLAYSNHDNFIKRSCTFLKFAICSLQFVFQLPYDLVFATSTPLTAGLPGIFARWLRRKPFVFEVRDLWPELPQAMGVITNPIILKTLSILEYVTYHSSHYIIALSPGMASGILKRGVPCERVNVISNGCDIELFQDTLPLARPLGVSKNDLMVIYTGTHGIANGLCAVLDAAAVLKQRGRDDIKFVLVGQGKLKSSLQQRAKEETLDTMIFLDPMPKKQLVAFVGNADLGLQILSNVPAFYDGTSPNKFFDYISAGLPVLINYPGWLADKVIAYACGFVVPPEDPHAFADALEYAAANKKNLVELGNNAFELATQEFSREKLSHEWIDIVEKVFNMSVRERNVCSI